MIANEPAPIADSLWTATAGPVPDCPPLSGEASADVAVVGAGFTGLSAALHLAEAGVSVAVLETETPGWGASGRNGGQVIPGLKYDPDEIEAMFGPEAGGRIVALAGGAADLVFSLIERHKIECDAARNGWIQPSHDKAALATAQSRAGQWSRRGAPVRVLSRREAADLLGSDAYQGGLLDERGGGLHPLNYSLGLARAALAAGARIHGHSRVVRLERAGDGFRLHTQAGSLRAGKVMLCTNGYTDALASPLERTVVPVRSIQVATRPLGDNLRRTILPAGHVASDSRRLLLYFRLDAEGRFLMGGRGAYGEGMVKFLQQRLREAAKKLYPQLADAEWAYSWGGYVALTSDHLPHLNRIEPNLIAALGYNGRGVAMATAMGTVLADWARGAREEDLAFPVTPVQPIPFHFLRKPAVSAVANYYRLRDAIGV